MEDLSLNETSGNGDEDEDDEEDCLITEGKNPLVATASTSDVAATVPGDIEIEEDVVSGESSPEMVERGDSSSSAAQVADPFHEDDVKMPDVRAMADPELF